MRKVYSVTPYRLALCGFMYVVDCVCCRFTPQIFPSSVMWWHFPRLCGFLSLNSSVCWFKLEHYGELLQCLNTAQRWDLGANTYDLYCGEYILNTPRRNLLVTSWNNGWWLSPNFVKFEINQHLQIPVIVCLEKKVAVVDPLIVLGFKSSKKNYKGSSCLP